jgi:hypothetical protein
VDKYDDHSKIIIHIKKFPKVIREWILDKGECEKSIGAWEKATIEIDNEFRDLRKWVDI